MLKLLVTIFLVLACFEAMPAFAGAKYANEAALRQPYDIAANARLVFRQANGRRISEITFFQRINQGEPFYFSDWGAEYQSVAVFTLGRPDIQPPPKGHITKLTSGEKLPRIDAISLDGRRVTQATFAKGTTLVDFFGIGCAACANDIPALNAFKASHRNVRTLAITADPAEDVRQLIEKRKFKWRVVPDAIPFAREVGIWFAPTFALIHNGRLIAISSGGDLQQPGKPLTSEDIAQWVSRHTAVARRGALGGRSV